MQCVRWEGGIIRDIDGSRRHWMPFIDLMWSGLHGHIFTNRFLKAVSCCLFT